MLVLWLFISEFSVWKDNMERETGSSFNVSTGKRQCTPGAIKHYFYCHRSGNYKCAPVDQRKRRKKTQGTCKIGKHCLASLQAKEKDDKVFVTFQKKHYGHPESDVEHQRLSSVETQVLAGKLFVIVCNARHQICSLKNVLAFHCYLYFY